MKWIILTAKHHSTGTLEWTGKRLPFEWVDSGWGTWPTAIAAMRWYIEGLEAGYKNLPDDRVRAQWAAWQRNWNIVKLARR